MFIETGNDIFKICRKFSAHIVKNVKELPYEYESVTYSSLEDLNAKLGVIRQQLGYFVPVYVLPNDMKVYSNGDTIITL